MKCAFYRMSKEEKSKALFDGTVNSKMKQFTKLADKYGEAEAYHRLTGKDPSEIKSASVDDLESKLSELKAEVDKQKEQMEQLTKATTISKETEEK